MKHIYIRIFIWVGIFIINIAMITQYFMLENQYASKENTEIVVTSLADYDKDNQEDYVLGTYLHENSAVTYEETSKQEKKVNIIWIDFSIENVMGSFSCLNKADKAGCIISSSLSIALFGTIEGIGQRVMLNGKNYIVRAVIDNDESILIAIRDDEENKSSCAISGVIIDSSKESYRDQYASMFCIQNGTTDYRNYYIDDYMSELPKLTLPTRMSDFDSWERIYQKIEAIKDSRMYENKDVIERYYYRLYNMLHKMRMFILCEVVLEIYIGIWLCKYFFNLKGMKKIQNI